MKKNKSIRLLKQNELFNFLNIWFKILLKFYQKIRLQTEAVFLEIIPFSLKISKLKLLKILLLI